jgi:hypothetical protein
MPRHPMARGIAVVIVHGRRLWAGPRHPAGVVLGARHGKASQQSGNRVDPQLPRSCLSSGLPKARAVGPCYQGVRPMT